LGCGVDGLNLYLRLRGWVDHDLKERSRPASLFFGIVPISPALILKQTEAAALAPVALVLGIVIGIGWTMFVGWRAVRLAKASAARADRAYDRQGKFSLASEYHASESATRAKRRQRSRQ
jgi:hypothetical protein